MPEVVEEFEDNKGQSESVYRRKTDDKMATRKSTKRSINQCTEN